MEKVYVIVAGYSDGSGYDVLRVLKSKERAERDLEMLQAVAMQNVRLHEVEMDDIE